jgi:glucose/arabinose dehydrogenase
LVRRFAAFSNEYPYPWQWVPAEVEACAPDGSQERVDQLLVGGHVLVTSDHAEHPVCDRDRHLRINPFGDHVWSYGHRNPQDIAFDSRGRLWEQEFGNSVMDETNLIVRGGNYGWPACEGTSGSCSQPGFSTPTAPPPARAAA